MLLVRCGICIVMLMMQMIHSDNLRPDALIWEFVSFSCTDCFFVAVQIFEAGNAKKCQIYAFFVTF